MTRATVTLKLGNAEPQTKTFDFLKDKDAKQFKKLLEEGARAKSPICTCTVKLEKIPD